MLLVSFWIIPIFPYFLSTSWALAKSVNGSILVWGFCQQWIIHSESCPSFFTCVIIRGAYTAFIKVILIFVFSRVFYSTCAELSNSKKMINTSSSCYKASLFFSFHITVLSLNPLFRVSRKFSRRHKALELDSPRVVTVMLFYVGYSPNWYILGG